MVKAQDAQVREEDAGLSKPLRGAVLKEGRGLRSTLCMSDLWLNQT